MAQYKRFACCDGDIIIVVGNEAQFEKLYRCLKLETLPADERFSSNAGGVNHREKLDKIIETVTKSLNQEHLNTKLSLEGIPCGRINLIDVVFKDPQVMSRRMALHLEGGLPGLACPIVVDGVRQIAERSAPRRADG